MLVIQINLIINIYCEMRRCKAPVPCADFIFTRTGNPSRKIQSHPDTKQAPLSDLPFS